MDTLTLALVIIGFLCGYIVFKEIMWHRHLDELEKKLMSKDLADYSATRKVEIDPQHRDDTIADPDNLIPLDEVHNPFETVIPRVLIAQAN